MRAWLLRASWWQLALVLGGAFAVLVTVGYRLALGVPWTVAVVIGVVGGGVFGPLMGAYATRTYRRGREVAGTDDPRAIRSAARAAWRGPLPADPEERARAHRLALTWREQLLRQRVWTIPAAVLLIALYVWAALARSPHWWLVAAFSRRCCRSTCCCPGGCSAGPTS